MSTQPHQSNSSASWQAVPSNNSSNQIVLSHNIPANYATNNGKPSLTATLLPHDVTDAPFPADISNLFHLVKNQNELSTETNKLLLSFIELKKNELSQDVKVRETIKNHTKEIVDSNAGNTKQIMDKLYNCFMSY